MAPLTLRLSSRALEQLYGILDYIALDNPEAADRVAAKVERSLEKVRSYPELGAQVFPGLPHREVKPYPCGILYHRREATVWIVAVLRTEQLLRPGHLEDTEP